MPPSSRSNDEDKTCWMKINGLKRILAFCCGAAIIIASVFTLINLSKALDFLSHIRMFWNILFGVLIIFLQLGWNKWVGRRFGFLVTWFGRGMFYLFVGTNVFTDEWWTYIVGGVTIGLGVLELMFGSKCVNAGDDPTPMPAEIGTAPPPGKSKKSSGFFGVFGTGESSGSKGAPVEPTGDEPRFTVSVNASQAAAAASAAVSAASTAAANAPPSDNPFFGNAHLQK